MADPFDLVIIGAVGIADRIGGGLDTDPGQPAAALLAEWPRRTRSISITASASVPNATTAYRDAVSL